MSRQDEGGAHLPSAYGHPQFYVESWGGTRVVKSAATHSLRVIGPKPVTPIRGGVLMVS